MSTPWESTPLRSRLACSCYRRMNDLELFRETMNWTPLLRNVVQAPVLLSLMAAGACSSSGTDHGGKELGGGEESAGGPPAPPSPPPLPAERGGRRAASGPVPQ